MMAMPMNTVPLSSLDLTTLPSVDTIPVPSVGLGHVVEPMPEVDVVDLP